MGVRENLSKQHTNLLQDIHDLEAKIREDQRRLGTLITSAEELGAIVAKLPVAEDGRTARTGEWMGLRSGSTTDRVYKLLMQQPNHTMNLKEAAAHLGEDYRILQTRVAACHARGRWFRRVGISTYQALLPPKDRNGQ